MKSELCVTLELEVADAQDASRFEEKLRGWLRHQSQVMAVTTTGGGVGSGAAWREARREAFGSRLPNPFAPGRER